MAKQSEKVTADKQPESQRGKSRFGVQPRSNRVVLPDRPPREIDNEIVSILLGGDPTSLSASDPEETPSSVVVTPPPTPAVITSAVEDRRLDENPDVSQAAAPLLEMRSALHSSETHSIPAKGSPTRFSPILEPPAERTPSIVETVPPASARGISGRNASLPRAGVNKRYEAPAEHVQDLAIASFEEFSERWRHGLRKGQLKVCEVLYHKTYALGETECVTSFSELGRLSGLKMRQCFNIIAQLEALKFVERAKSENTSNKKDQGSIIRFYLFPKS